MASSFSEQIPVILWVVGKLNPHRILDIGKGFGKYGMLIHEYMGLDPQRRPSPNQSMREQSRVVIDAVDINLDYSLPHLQQFYNEVIVTDICHNYQRFTGYDVVLMIDVIEHLPKEKGLRIVDWFLGHGAHVLISTPIEFFQQEIYGSDAEHHVSHWRLADFVDRNMNWQNCGASRLYLLSPQAVQIRGFGSSLLHRLRRLGRALKNEFT